jgi:xanthine dehydrogenase accessory factor
VATWGWDEPALAQVLAADPPPAYVGLVASPTKARAIFEQLAQRGLPQARLDLVRAPIGLDLGAETPEEIALAIVAEILAVRRKASGRPLFEARKPRQESEGA